mgnify:CR=1 FL=1
MKLIFAHDLNGGIGFKNNLPWRIYKDMKFFKDKIKDKVTVAGKNTYNSVPFKVTHLATREGFKDLRNLYKEFYIIGGAIIYNEAIKELQPGDVIYETKIYDVFKADTFFALPKNLKYEKTIIFDGECDEKKYEKKVRVKIIKKKMI